MVSSQISKRCDTQFRGFETSRDLTDLLSYLCTVSGGQLLEVLREGTRRKDLVVPGRLQRASE